MDQGLQDQNRYINLTNARSDAQRAVMQQIEERRECPFCRENLEKYHKNPILKEGRFWLLTENQWPYEKVKHQLLAIYKTHVERLQDLDSEAGTELFSMFGEESRERKIEGGGVAIRFGSSPDGNYGSTVLHVHAHLIEPDLRALGETEAWKFKFGQPKNYKKAAK